MGVKRKYNFYVSIGYVGCTREEVVELEFDDDATEEDIEAEVKEYHQDWVNNSIDTNYWQIEE